MAKSYSVKRLMRDLRVGTYGDGGYPQWFLTADCNALHPNCVRENLWQVARATRDKNDKQWQIVGHDTNWEDSDLYCDHCGKRIESAYAEPEEHEEAGQ